ncbi:MAG: hypothetical protein LBU89_08220 [Fibromonadaceae bacterium]|jgi:F0F1-type ATP synthase alpha subunit|nr:hypothetical protein [Fibromonadaceae bacterium]
MRKISIKAVKDGMILAEPLKNAHGGLLLEKGTALTAAFAARLAQRGISTVIVEGEPEPGEEGIAVVQAAEIPKISLEELFDGKIVNNSMQIIYEALIRNRESSDQ